MSQATTVITIEGKGGYCRMTANHSDDGSGDTSTTHNATAGGE